jgi:flavin-dependent thymidylate synthase
MEFAHPQELLDKLEEQYNSKQTPMIESADAVLEVFRRMGYHGDYDVRHDRVSDTYKFTYKPHEDDPEEITPTSTDVSTYVDRAMFTAEEMDADALAAPRVFLLSATPDPLGAVAAMSMMYEGRVIRDLAEITDDERRHYYDECFKTTLKAPLEAIDFHFMVEGVTRAHTHQEVRQRTAVFAQESMRFAVKEKIAARPGPLISQDAEAKKTWEKGVEFIHQLYLTLIAQGIPAEEARGLLPHDTLTRLHHKVNLKNLMDELGKRTCTQAQFDWKMWAAGVKAAIHNYKGHEHGDPERGYCKNGWQFEYIAASPIFHPICFNTGHCMFKAQMDRGCTIRERVERGAFDEIRPEEWAADPRAAWVR